MPGADLTIECRCSAPAWLYLPGRGVLREELTEALRTGRAKRRPKGPKPGRGKRGKITNVVEISERPAEANGRAVPGHWEGDLMLGRSGRSQIGVIVERTSRFVQLIALPNDRKAATVRDAIAAKIGRLPIDLTRSLTWDLAKRWPNTCSSRSIPASTCSSATPLALAARHCREHQRAAPSVPAPQERLLRTHPGTASTRSPTNSTDVLAKPSTERRPSEKFTELLHPPVETEV